jgi:dihydroxyacetone kinase DhaKLM complex PTS-EIIA-like component DhaM
MSNRKTDTAISLAGGGTGNALGTSYGKVTHSLKKSAHEVGRFLRGDGDGAKPEAKPQP